MNKKFLERLKRGSLSGTIILCNPEHTEKVASFDLVLIWVIYTPNACKIQPQAIKLCRVLA